jgi:Flp pilus assembly protein TadD
VIKLLKVLRRRGVYTEITAKLRGDPELARVIPITLEVDVPGGMVELQRNVASAVPGDRAARHVHQGFDALSGSSSSPIQAQQHFTEALRLNSSHSEALYGMAHALWRAGDASEALSVVDEAIAIEPNELSYRRTQIELARATGQYSYGLHLYRQAARVFEHVYDLEGLAAELLLDAGNPDEARRCVSRAILTGDQKAELAKTTDEAIAARTRARALMHEALASVQAKNWKAASSTLLRAQAIYNRDPELCMNTAFATLHDGDPRVCAGLMLHASSVVSDVLAATCVVNAGLAMLKAGEFEHAIGILDMAAMRLTYLFGGETPESTVDLPSVGVWIEGDELREERVTVAADLLSGGLARARKQHVDVPTRVHALETAYRRAAATAVL